MQQIQFCKMHGLGNDFIVIDAINQIISLNKSMIKKLSDRHLGIGFDQLLLIEKSHKADFACRIFNADGSEAEQCGNGMRCVARFIQEESLSNKKSLTIETKARVIDVVIQDYDNIRVNLGAPFFQPKEIPFIADKVQNLYELNIDDSSLKLAVVSMGNPHAIMRVPSIKSFPVTEMGTKIAAHAVFPKSVNVGFVEIVNRKFIKLRTFERGTGETFACGSNSCAAVVAGIINDWLDHAVTVELAYGNLHIEWQGKNNPVMMTGPASRVFAGNILL